MVRSGKPRPVKHTCPVCGRIVVDDLVKHKARVHNDKDAQALLDELESQSWTKTPEK